MRTSGDADAGAVAGTAVRKSLENDDADGLDWQWVLNA
jgi:hypothetical protein